MDSTDLQRIEALLVNKPYKRYIKATLGRVAVKVLDPMSLKETEIILEGDPKSKPDTAILDVWTAAEDVYFNRSNKVILADGLIIPYGEDIDQPNTANVVSDEELKEALTKKYFSVKNMLDRFTKPAPVERMLALAEELDRPVKTIDAIKAKLAELQAQEYENIGLLTMPDPTSEE